MNNFLKVLAFIFGDNPGRRFKRVIIYTIVVSVSVMLILNVGCGVKEGKFYFEWKPADVKIDYSKGK